MYRYEEKHALAQTIKHSRRRESNSRALLFDWRLNRLALHYHFSQPVTVDVLSFPFHAIDDHSGTRRLSELDQ